MSSTPSRESAVPERIREGYVVVRRAIEDLKPGDLVQHYSTWEQTYGDPIHREVVAVEYDPDARSHKRLVTWRIPDDRTVVQGSRDDYQALDDPDKKVDVVLRKAPPPDLCEGVSIPVDGSWADTLPPCVACKREVPWGDALLMPCSTVEDGDVDCVGIVHKGGCPDA